jgi:hypothetical protein
VLTPVSDKYATTPESRLSHNAACMAFEALTAREQDIVLRCLKATAAHVDDSEKHSRLGLEPDELKRIITAWPHIDDASEDGSGFLAINNSLNEVCHGFRIDPEQWNNWFETPKQEIAALYRKWLRIRGVSGGIR